MKTKDLVFLASIYMMNFIAVMMVIPFLPIFVFTFPNVESGIAGLFFAVTSVALTIGTIVGGWLAEKFQRRKLLIQVSGIIAFVTFFLVQYVTQLWQLTILISFSWFAFGIATTMVRVIAGILADKTERGRVFGIISASVPTSALISGFIGGRIVDQWGFAALFTIVSFAFLVEIGLTFFIQDVKVKPSGETSEKSKRFQAGLPYWLLVLSVLLAYIALAELIVGRPLLMTTLGFEGKAISGVLIAGGLVSLPMTFLIGTLSDRFGRKNMIIVCLLLAIPGMAILSFAQPIWHFWASEILLVGISLANVVGFAFVADLVPPESLDTAMSYFSAASWGGTIIGNLVVGYLIDAVGLSIMFMSASVILMISFMIVIPIITPTKLKMLPEL